MKHSPTLSSVQQMAFLLLMRSDCICVSSFMSSYETGFNLTASLLSLSHVFDVFPSSLFCFPNLRIVFLSSLRQLFISSARLMNFLLMLMCHHLPRLGLFQLS